MSNYALILAGGSGTRFWPLSRNTRPKQLLDLFGTGTLLCQAIERLSGIVPAENIFILTNHLQEEEVRRQAVSLPAENIVAEPARRDTAPAVALGIGLIAARDPQANMIIIPSDALITNSPAFRALAADALSLAGRENALITIGIKPTWPCPSYGYIERAGKLEDATLTHNCYEVVRFREKPDTATAQQYLASGNFSWNAGMFIWNVAHVRSQLATHSPELADFINRLTALFRQTRFYDKALFAVVVSGYSGSDTLARQLISGMNMNKSFYLPPRFALMETANDPGQAMAAEGIGEKLDSFAAGIRAALLAPVP